MNYNHPIKNNSTITIRVMCAIVFAVFSFAWLYFFQADLLAMVQHVHSGGRTAYRPLLGAILLTTFLLLLQLFVFRIIKLKRRFHALTYGPSMLLLGLLTCFFPTNDGGIAPDWHWYFPVIVLTLWLLLVFLAKLLQEVENERDYSLLSRPMWINMLLLALQIMFVVWTGNTNAVIHYRMKTELLLSKGDYQKALEVGKRSLESDSCLLMLRMYALAHENILGERLFEYPITGTSAQMLPTNGPSSLSLCPADSFYRFFGARPATPMVPMRYLQLLEHHDSIVAPQVANYKLSGLLIDRQIERFAREIGKYYALDDYLPKHYREALLLYAHSTSHPVVVYRHAVTEEDWRNYQELKKQYTDPTECKVKLFEQYRDTYWYYFEYER